MTEALRYWADAAVGKRVEVVIAHDGGTPPRGSRATWVAVRHIGPSWARLPVDLEPVFDGADLVVMQSAWAGHNVRAGAVARRAGVPYVLEPRGAYDPHIVRRKALLKRLWWTAWERRLMAGALATHVFFEPERAHLEALGYRGPVIVAPNGVDDPGLPAWDGGSGGYILWLGRFDPEHKGLDLLVSAVASLAPERRPLLRLHGPDRQGGKAKVTRSIEAQGLSRWIVIGDAVYGDAKRRLVTEATGFVYPSRWEAFGNAPAQAVAAGVPTLVTPYPLGRYLADNGAAIMVGPTPRELADGLDRLRSPEAAGIGHRGATLVRQAFDWQTVVETWLVQVDGLLGTRSDAKERAGLATTGEPGRPGGAAHG